MAYHLEKHCLSISGGSKQCLDQNKCLDNYSVTNSGWTTIRSEIRAWISNCDMPTSGGWLYSSLERNFEI